MDHRAEITFLCFRVAANGCLRIPPDKVALRKFACATGAPTVQNRSAYRTTSTARISISVIMLLACLVQTRGCTEGTDCASALYVRGKLIDGATGTALTDAAVAGQTFTDGERTDFGSARLPASGALTPQPAEDGSFELVFNTGDQFPCPRLGPLEFPRPDQVDVIVVRDACVQRFLIEISEDTVVDLDSSHENVDIIELKDPILVPPCKEQDVP